MRMGDAGGGFAGADTRSYGSVARKRFFFEKRSKKLLFTAGCDGCGARARKSEVFTALD
jgi:hypothetical protein